MINESKEHSGQGENSKTDLKLQDRLRSEAEFQNRRVLAEGDEPRDKFYYLVVDAYADYSAAVGTLAGKDVLVVGCSEGGVTPLARMGARVVGVDISDAAIARLNNAIRREGLSELASVRVMNAEDLDFPAESFDAIICTGVLHHLDIERACRSWSRVLRSEGEVLMLEPLALNPAAALYRLMTPSMRTPDEHPLLPRDFRLMRQWFGRVDFNAYAFLTFVSLPFAYIGNPWNLKERTRRLLAPVDRLLFRVLPPARHLGWTCFLRCGAPRPYRQVSPQTGHAPEESL